MDVCWGYRLPCDSRPCCAVATHSCSMPLRFRSIAGPCNAVAVLSFAVPPRFFALPCHFDALTRCSLTPRCARSFAVAFRSLHSHSLPLLLIASTAPLLCALAQLCNAVAWLFGAMPSLRPALLVDAMPLPRPAQPCSAIRIRFCSPLFFAIPLLLRVAPCNSAAARAYLVISVAGLCQGSPCFAIPTHCLAFPRYSLSASGFAFPFRSFAGRFDSLAYHVHSLPFPCSSWLCPRVSRPVRAMPSPFRANLCLRVSELLNAFAWPCVSAYAMPLPFEAIPCRFGSHRSYSVSCLSNAFSVNG